MLSYLSLSAIFLISGIYLCDFFPHNTTYILILVLLIIGIGFFLTLKEYRRYILVATFFICLGVAECSFAKDIRFNAFNDINNKYVTVEGYVSDVPEQIGDIYSYKLKTTHAEYLNKEYKAGQTIKVTSNKALNYGDTVRIKGFLKEFSDKKNSTDFNTKRYYQSRKIFFKIHSNELEHINSDTSKNTLSYWFNSYKNHIAKIIDKEFPGDTGAVLKAITLNIKSEFSHEFKNLLTRTGMMKFFYPSFLHISLISSFIAILFRFFKKSWRNYILIAFMILYSALNSYSPVFLKNSIMVISGILILKKYGFSHRPDIISLTILIIAVTNPLYCFDVGFVMSVSTGLLLYYFNDILGSLLSFIPYKAIRNFLIFYIITTLATLPLTAYYFNGVSLYSNLLAPLYAFITGVMIILIYIMYFFITLFGTSFFIRNFILWFSAYYTVVPVLINKIPFSHIQIGSPDITLIIMFFGILYILYQLYLKELSKPKNICVICICAGLFCSFCFKQISSSGNMNITFVNVGHGDAAIIDIIGKETILIDGGGKNEFSEYDAGEHIFVPYLTNNGYFNIDKAFISHYHSDHCLGIIAAMKSLNVEEVLMPDYSPENVYRLEIERIAAEKGIKLTYLSKGDTITFPSGMIINVLSPSSEDLSFSEDNKTCLVLQVEYNNFKCLFTGDIGIDTELGLIKDIGNCDVVKMAHHGSKNSNSVEFARAIDAEYAVISIDKENMYGLPSPQAIYNYQKTGTKIVRTDTNGDITVTVKKNGNYNIYRNIR